MRTQGGALLRSVGVAAACCLCAGSVLAAKLPSPDFDAFLAEGYSQMAAAGPSTDDARASYFHQRAALAGRGGELLPASPDKTMLDSSTLREASYARRQLLHRLDAGARQKRPLLAAIAQVNFDCWVAPAPKQSANQNSNECRRRFYFAFAGLTPGGSDRLPEGSPTELAGTSGPMGADPGSEITSPPPAASRRLIATPPQSAHATASAGSPRDVRLASVSGSETLGSETLYSPADQGSLARLIQSILRETKCDRTGRNCAPLRFTGPSADLLIRNLRDSGPDNAASGGAGLAGNAAGGEDGNGRGKGNGHGNGHGKGPG
jgi:hypothetical protein